MKLHILVSIFHKIVLYGLEIDNIHITRYFMIAYLNIKNDIVKGSTPFFKMSKCYLQKVSK